MEKIVLRPASVRMELTVTTSLDSVHVALASWGTTVNKSVLLVLTVMAAAKSVTV